jgi:diaminopimelate epimerase
MYNVDGSRGQMCGNGIRCVAKYAFDHGLARRNPMRIETDAGVLTVDLLLADGRVSAARVNMGRPRMAPTDLPTTLRPEEMIDHLVEVRGRKLPMTCVSMGNPHAVAFVDTPVTLFPLEEIGPRIEHHALFPRRVNFEVVNITSRRELDVRVWERGAGITLACGTGACGVVAVARAKGLVDERVRVNMPGGPLEIAWDGAGDVMMTGPATLVFEGEWVEERPARADVAR